MSDIKSYLDQHDSYLITKKPCELIIDLLNYKIDDNLLIKEDDNIVYLDQVITRIEYADTSFNIVLDYGADVFFNPDNYLKEEDYIKIEYKSGDTILQTRLDVENIGETIKYTERLLGGKILFKDISHLYNKLYKVFGPVSDADSVHLEVLLSQVLRSKKDPSLPARMVDPFDPTMINIKDVSFKNSFLSGLMFENIGKAINQGLISEDQVPPSILERLFTGDLV